jgi:hypothetical protein
MERAMSSAAQSRYVSPEQLEELFPYHRQTWRRWHREGLLPGSLKPSGRFGRLLIDLREAQELLERRSAERKEPAGETGSTTRGTEVLMVRR